MILFGDDEGAAEVCAELGLRHEPHVERHEREDVKRLELHIRARAGDNGGTTTFASPIATSF